VRDQEQPTDCRLLVLSEEFAGVLHLLAREKGHLSPLLRCAWDSGNLHTLHRHRPLQTTGAHKALDATPAGLTRDQIRTLFHRHIRSERIDAALEQLTAEGNITSQKSRGKGRPSTLWSATEDADSTPD
jgi:hypothetical protein